MLHSNAMCCAEYLLEGARNQRATVWRVATVDRKVQDEICRSLSPTPKASRWQTCAMGTTPARGNRWRGHPMATFLEVLARDAGVESSAELARCMDEREDWKIRLRTRLRTT